MQYAAVVLRTVDLLQITKGRAPSVLYQIINPTDPLSQVEWQKQGAVRNVRKKPPAVVADSPEAISLTDTIEVHALFEQPDGFFGLTSYIAYAQTEIQACHAAIEKSAKTIQNAPVYPWKFFDTSGIEAKGFSTKSFGFTLDQQKILDLLTGHTLYNDTSVVLRELTQNALDAVRLQAKVDKLPAPNAGKIEIHWNTASKILVVKDNGTGMTQDTIEKHLLKVGSSRYQDPNFKETYPDFTSISRFGIGVLSAFMISDDVQITTCSEDDDGYARRIALRSVHGQYLIKFLDKVSDRNEIEVFPHGTLVRLVLRPTADLENILQIAQQWLMFPECLVTLKVDDDSPISVGYSSPKEAIEAYLSSSVQGRPRYRRNIEVREEVENGVTLAFAVAKNELFGDWSFVEVQRENLARRDEHDVTPIGTCIGGVGVEFHTPGYGGATILAVANAVGKNAPKTNVARSALEDTPELRLMLSTIYKLYAKHVSKEIARLARDEGYSLSRAVNEAPYIASQLMSSNVPLIKPSLMQEAISEIPMVIMENTSGRTNIPFKDLMQIGEWWTVESPLSRSIETFVREAPSDITAASLLKTLGNSSSAYPSQNTMCSYGSSSYIDYMISDEFDISEIAASQTLRRINLKWARIGDKQRWLHTGSLVVSLAQSDRRFYSIVIDAVDRGRSRSAELLDKLHIPLQDMPCTGLENFGGFESNRDVYYKPDLPVTSFFRSLWKGPTNLEAVKEIVSYALVLAIVRRSNQKWDNFSADLLDRYIDHGSRSVIFPYLSRMEEFTAAVKSSNSVIFDPFAWDRRDEL